MYNLALFVSLNPSPPCFAIPVFTSKFSNQTFAQDLRPTGQIDKFLLIDPECFHQVHCSVPAENRRIGERGIIAFWLDYNHVISGTATDVAEQLKDVSIGKNSPFVRVERAIFLGEEKEIRQATELAAPFLASASARESYLSRVKARIRIIEKLQESHFEQAQNSIDDLDTILAFLEREKNPEIWVTTWINTWLNIDDIFNDRLFNIAKWKIASHGLGHLEYQILDALRFHDDKATASGFFLWWLQNRKPEQVGWICVWQFVAISYESFSVDLVLKGLSHGFANQSLRRQRWPLIGAWQAAYATFKDRREDIIDIARRFDRNFSHNSLFTEIIVLTVYRDNSDNEWCCEHLGRFFRRYNGSASWISLFSIYAARVMSREAYIDVSLKWLRRFGRGTNRWFDIFTEIRPFISDSEAWVLRAVWLQTAGKRLKSWPEVFESLADEAGEENYQELKSLARLWVRANPRKHANHVIDDFASR